jgi:hypothetical protein
VTATLTEDLFLKTYYILLSPHIRQVKWRGGIWMVNTIPTGLHTAQLDLHTNYRVSNKYGVFPYNHFVIGEDDKAIFSIPGDTLSKTFQTLSR